MMDGTLGRIWQELANRATDPMRLRLLLQPAMAAVLAIRGGLQDARLGQPPYSWTVLTTDPTSRRRLLKDGWKSIVKVFCAAAVLDAVYQIRVRGWVHVGGALLVATLLACVPYLLLRGLVNRLLRVWWRARRTEDL